MLLILTDAVITITVTFDLDVCYSGLTIVSKRKRKCLMITVSRTNIEIHHVDYVVFLWMKN